MVEIATVDGYKKVHKQLEMDFVVDRGNDRYYIPSVLSIVDPEKKKQETVSLLRLPDSLKSLSWPRTA